MAKNTTTIDPKKAKAFSSFIKENAKTSEYWEKVCEEASTPINKKELDALFDNANEAKTYTATIDYNTEYIGGIWPSDTIVVSVGPAQDTEAAIDNLMKDAEEDARVSILSAYLEDGYMVDVTAHIQITDADGNDVAWTDAEVHDEITDEMIPAITIYPAVDCDGANTGVDLEITHYYNGDIDSMALEIEDAIASLMARLIDGDQTYIANAVSVDLDTGYVIIADAGNEKDYPVEWTITVYPPEDNPDMDVDLYVDSLRTALDGRSLDKYVVVKGHR